MVDYHMRPTKPPNHPATCPGCGYTRKVKRADQRYCNRSCRQRAYRRRQRGETAPTPHSTPLVTLTPPPR